MSKRSIAMMHYAGPPGIGGVEATIAAHTRVLSDLGRPVRWLVGRGGAGTADAGDPRRGPEGSSGPGRPPGNLAPWAAAEVGVLPALDSRGQELDAINRELAAGRVPPEFPGLVGRIAGQVAPLLRDCDAVIVHNVLTMHKNLALTAALRRLSDAGDLPGTILAWAHDLAWRDPVYANDLHAGYPWDLLRTAWPGVRYVTVSADRRAALGDLLGLPQAAIPVVPPGVDVDRLLNLSDAARALADRFDLLAADPFLLLPARITRRKNIEAAIAIVAALRDDGARPCLVVTGPPGPHNPANAAYLAHLEWLIARDGLEQSVILLHRRWLERDGSPRPVSDALVAELYRLADALLMPSASEGFGMPILEAALVGLPIVCSDLPSFREIAGEAAAYFDLRADPRAVAGLIRRTLGADPRLELRRRVRQAWSWDSIFRHQIVPLLNI